MSSGMCVFSAPRIIHPVLGQIQLRIKQTARSRSRIRQRDIVDAVVESPHDSHCTAASPPLSGHRFWSCPSHQCSRWPLDAHAGPRRSGSRFEHRIVPGNRIEQPLQRPGCHLLVKRHGLDILPLHARHQSANIHQQQNSPGTRAETSGEPGHKLPEHPASLEYSSLTSLTWATFRGFRVKVFNTEAPLSALYRTQH